MRLSVPEEAKGARLDVWLDGQLDKLSRSRIQSLIRSGHITVEGRKVSCHFKVKKDMVAEVEVPPPEPVDLIAQDIPLDVIHEDGDVIVVNKQAGLVVHPAAGHASGTLVNALLFRCKDLAGVGGELRPGIVHRLDKDTSGVMVSAKNERAMAGLVDQFKEGRVRKEYLAIVIGIPLEGKGTIETLIGRSSHDRKKMSARPASGRKAITHYEVIEKLDGASLLRVTIETGRTHQIRVHLTHIGHPVLGDKQYGGKKYGSMRVWESGSYPARQMLHAEVLGFAHPGTGEEVLYKAPWPEDMKQIIGKLTIS